MLTNPSEILFHGQKGVMPSLVKLSEIRCEEYPKKKGKAKIGRVNARTSETKIQRVRL